MKNEITFLGTGSGKTSLNRFHSSLLFNMNNKLLLVDAGDSISRALLFNKINMKEIDAIIISHFHADHYAGLASLLTQMYISKRTKKLSIFAHGEYIEQLKNFVNQSYLFDEVLPFKINYSGFSFFNNTSLFENFEFLAKQNSHVQNKHGLSSYNSIKFISSSFLFETEKQKIFYTADIGKDEDLFLFDLSSVNILISEITHIEKEIFPQILQSFPHLKIYLTHINEESINDLIIWKDNLEKSFQERIIIAKDGMKISI